MKKTLLTVACLVALYAAQAQSTSFEASEGFTEGDINGQNEWFSSSYDDGSGTTAYITNQVIANGFSSDGTSSFYAQEEPEFDGQDGPVIGAFKDVAMAGPETLFSVDVFPVDQISGGADYSVNLTTANAETANIGIRINFGYLSATAPATIKVVDFNTAGTLSYINTGVEWEAGQWYNLRAEVDGNAGTIVYYLDDAIIYEGAPLATEFDGVALTHDNWGGTVFFDNLVLSNSLSVSRHDVATFAVAPNPTSGNVVIGNTGNANITKVTVSDLNGRTVKSLPGGTMTNLTVDMSDLTTGVYMMNINSDSGSVTKKIIKK